MATRSAHVYLSANGDTFRESVSVLEFRSIKSMAILLYDFKTVASCAQGKVKAGRLLVQKQLVMLGGSFGCFCSAIPAPTSVNRMEDSDTTSSFCP